MLPGISRDFAACMAHLLWTAVVSMLQFLSLRKTPGLVAVQESMFQNDKTQYISNAACKQRKELFGSDPCPHMWIEFTNVEGDIENLVLFNMSIHHYP